MRVILKDVVYALQKKEYKIFTDPYELNIVGIRSADLTPDIFNDMLIVFWNTENIEEMGLQKQFRITTDPGLYWLNNPTNIDGTAILFPGQYDAYQIDKHRGKYDALCQRRAEVKVYRDNDKDNRYNPSFTQMGYFGINIHKAGLDSVKVDKWSAGCQVFQNEADFNEFMELCQTHRAIHGNKFTYTLITEVDLIHI